ncbi:MAG: tripartite tricarboxylate transporter substrate binding protein [Burkholderiales bacterium]|nr:tripartite tricarboxylate transporter substrate binding protein [Burkholderiales bacterium]
MIPARLRSLAIAALGLAAMTAAFAQTFPDRPVRFIVPNPPGNVGDIVARQVADQLSRTWKQPAIVENRPGANSMIGVEAVARAGADGYTLLFSPGGNVTASAALIPTLAFKPAADLVPVHRGVRVPVWMVVAAGSPHKTLRDVVDAARRAPGKVTFWSGGGQADRPYFALAEFQAANGIEFGWVGYKGAVDALRDVAGGLVDFAVVGIAPAKPLIDGGRLRVIALMENQRSSAAPGVPTFAEAGFAGDYGESWTGVFAPRGTPPEVLRRLGADIGAALANPELRARLTAAFVDAVESGPEEAARRVQADSERWSALIRRLGIKLQ